MIIYIIKNNINKKMYVGQTRMSLKERWRHHTTKGNLLYSAIKKYGKDNFSIEILSQTTTKEKLNLFEKIAIKKLNTISPNGYNLREGGEKDYSLTEETKQKLRKINLGKPTGRHIDMTGQKIGLALFLKPIDIVGGRNYKLWECLCDCGKTFIAKRTITAKRRKAPVCCPDCSKRFKTEMTHGYKEGKRFGKLTVVKFIGRATYICVCDCGKHITGTGTELSKFRKTCCN